MDELKRIQQLRNHITGNCILLTNKGDQPIHTCFDICTHTCTTFYTQMTKSNSHANTFACAPIHVRLHTFLHGCNVFYMDSVYYIYIYIYSEILMTITLIAICQMCDEIYL